MQLKDRIQNALDESRMLVLGAEILVGFQFTAILQKGFKELALVSQQANLGALALMLFVLALLISPVAYHQITVRGTDSPSLLRFTEGAMRIALAPFAIALGASVFIPAREIGGSVSGIFIAIAMTALAFVFWYGPALLRRAQHPKSRKVDPTMPSKGKEIASSTSLHDKIRQVLTEARVILPGNQALLGFQLAVILQQPFRNLAPVLQWLHLASLLLMALSTILLLAPAPYHRIVERGEETESFYKVTSFLVVCSLPPLAAGICGDFFVVVYAMTQELTVAWIASGFMVIIFTTMWLAYPWFHRSHRYLVKQSV